MNYKSFLVTQHVSSILSRKRNEVLNIKLSIQINVTLATYVCTVSIHKENKHWKTSS